MPTAESFLPAAAAEAADGPARSAQHFARRSWQRPARKVAVSIVILVNVIGVTSGVGLRPSFLNLASTRGSTAASTGSPQTAVDPAGALALLAAQHTGSDSSGPVASAGGPSAVIAYSATADVYQLVNGSWKLRSSLALDYGVVPKTPVAHAEVTSDGQPDFLVTTSDGDATFGSVISAQIGTWEVVPFQSTNGPEASTPGVTFSGGHLVSQHVTWRYDPANDSFQPANVSGR